MFLFRNLPIRRKLTLIILSTSAIALLFATGATVAYEIVHLRHALVRELSTEAAIIAENSSAALAFADAKTAQETLKALQAQPGIVQACLFTPDGKIFAEYKSDETIQDLPDLILQSPGHRFEPGYVLVFGDVIFGGDVVGNIALRSDLRDQNASLRASASIAVVALLAALLVALVLSLKLQRIISTPVLELADVAHRVTIGKDYSLRAVKRGNDEIGVLMEEFNQMLAQIEERDDNLRASEQRFRQMAESIREVFWLSDLEKNQVFYVSPGFETIWGRSCEELRHSQRIWLDSIHSEDRPRITQAATTKQVMGEYDEEYRIIRPDGTIRWIHDRAFPVQDATGKIYRLAGIAEDITKRKQTEEALQQSEAHYRQLVELAQEGIWSVDADGHTAYANPHMAEMLGYTMEEMSGKHLFEFMDASGIALCQRNLDRRKQGISERHEFEFIRKDGSRILTNMETAPITDAAGTYLGAIACVSDITQRKSAEETLRRMEQLYRRAITGAGAVPYAYNYETKSYLFMGEGIEKLTGYAHSEIHPAFWQNIKQESIMLGEAAGMSVETAEKLVATGEVKNWQCDMRILTRDGKSRWISDVAVQNRDESGQLTGTMGILQDITERKQAEKKSAAFALLASRLSAASTPEAAAANIMETAMELIGWDCGFVHLYDWQRDCIVPILTFDLVDGERTTVPPPSLNGPSPMTRWIIKNGALLLDQQSRASMPFAFVPFGNKNVASSSMMYVPIRQGETVIGVLSIQSYTSNNYCNEELDLLQALADHCSGALQRIRASRELLEAEAKYRTIFEGATEGIFQTTPAGKYLRGNPALARMFGYETFEKMAASVSDIEGQTYVLPERRRELKRLLEWQGEVLGFEAERYRRDGSKFWMSINARAVRDDRGAILYFEGTTRDITNRRHLEKQLIEISDREQSRMGQDLHDGLCQHLVRTAFAANLLEKDLVARPGAPVDQAKKVARLVDEAITQARNLARGLYPVKLESEGFYSAMQELAANIRAAHKLECDFESADSISIDDHAVATHLYRIAQEGANNAAKHAQPKQIQIRLRCVADKIHLTISDDGTGMSAAPDRTNGMGLHIMNYRAGMIGAALKIERQLNGGTLVSCIFEHRNSRKNI